MIEAAEKALWDYAGRFNIVSLDEIHRETIGVMIEASILRHGAS
jgi:hypothetical protein